MDKSFNVGDVRLLAFAKGHSGQRFEAPDDERETGKERASAFVQDRCWHSIHLVGLSVGR
jgi:hypothetical protein